MSEGDESVDSAETASPASASEDVALEPFNLNEERASGTLDEGHVSSEDEPWQLEKSSQAPVDLSIDSKEEKSAVINSLKTLVDVLQPTQTPEEAIEDASDPDLVDKVTEQCNVIIAYYPDVYDTERELITRWYTQLSGSSIKRQRPQEWEFRWSDAPEVYGPYSTSEIKHWVDHGYFASGAEIRELGTTKFTNIDNVFK